LVHIYIWITFYSVIATVLNYSVTVDSASFPGRCEDWSRSLRQWHGTLKSYLSFSLV